MVIVASIQSDTAPDDFAHHRHDVQIVAGQAAASHLYTRLNAGLIEVMSGEHSLTVVEGAGGGLLGAARASLTRLSISDLETALARGGLMLDLTLGSLCHVVPCVLDVLDVNCIRSFSRSLLTAAKAPKSGFHILNSTAASWRSSFFCSLGDFGVQSIVMRLGCLSSLGSEPGACSGRLTMPRRSTKGKPSAVLLTLQVGRPPLMMMVALNLPDVRPSRLRAWPSTSLLHPRRFPRHPRCILVVPTVIVLVAGPAFVVAWLGHIGE